MKSAGQTFQKMKQVRYRHIKREIEGLLRKTPRNCANNSQLQTKSGSLGVCKLDCQLCDEQANDRFETCEDFSPSHSREEVKASLQNFFSSRSIPEISVRYPDVAALLWVLEGEDLEGEKIPEDREDYFPGSVFVGEYSGAKVWADSEEEARSIRTFHANLHADAIEQQRTIQTLKEELSQFSSLISSLKEENQRLRDSQSQSAQTLNMLKEAHQTLIEGQKNMSEVENSLLLEKAERIADLEREVERLSAKLPSAPISFWARIFK